MIKVFTNTQMRQLNAIILTIFTLKNTTMTHRLILLSLLLVVFCSSLDAQWTEVNSSPNFFTDHTFGFSLEGKGYLVAGSDQFGILKDDVYQYDPLSDSYRQLPPFPGGARGFAIGDTWDGKAYFGFGSAQETLRDLWVFDPTSESWEQLSSCPCTPRNHPALVAHNGKVFMGLGSGDSSNLKDWWIYDIATDTWTEGQEFPGTRRHHPYQFGIGEYIYVGLGHGADIYNDWYRYDPAQNTWDRMASLPGEGRVAGTQFSHNGIGYVLSGEGQDHLAMDDGEFFAYDPEADTWTEMPSHTGTSRWAPASFVVNDEVYVIGGAVYGFGNPFYPREIYKYNLVDMDTAIDDLDNSDQISINPNPAKDVLSVQLKAAELETEFLVIDMLGVVRMRFNSAKSSSLNISQLENGTYVLSSQDGEIVKTFVVSRG